MLFTLAANSRPISSASSSKCREYGKRDVNVIKFSKIKFTQNLQKSTMKIFVKEYPQQSLRSPIRRQDGPYHKSSKYC